MLGFGEKTDEFRSLPSVLSENSNRGLKKRGENLQIPININLMIIPTVNEMTIINPAALSIFQMPNSRSKTTNVAIQGKYVANIMQEIVNCCGLISKGNNMPIAISFLRNPIINATIAPSGKPSRVVRTGEKTVERTSITPNTYSRFTMKTPNITNGTASARNPYALVHVFF